MCTSHSKIFTVQQGIISYLKNSSEFELTYFFSISLKFSSKKNPECNCQRQDPKIILVQVFGGEIHSWLGQKCESFKTKTNKFLLKKNLNILKKIRV